MKAANAKKYLKQATASGKSTGGKPVSGFVTKEDEVLMDEMLESGQAEGPESDTEYTEQELRDEGLTWDSPADAASKKKPTKSKGKK